MTVGVDVSKNKLDYGAKTTTPRSVDNTPEGISSLLEDAPPGSVIAMEATGRYHKLLADTAHLWGFKVVVHNPKDVSKYAKSV